LIPTAVSTAARQAVPQNERHVRPGRDDDDSDDSGEREQISAHASIVQRCSRAAPAAMLSPAS
jgi:hypothetical protein